MKNFIFGLSLVATASISFMARGATLEEMQQNCYFDPMHSTSSCCFVSYCDVEYRKGLFSIGGSAPSIDGFQQDVGFTDSYPNCAKVTSNKFTSQEECQATFDALPNKCAVTQFANGSTREPILILKPDMRPTMSADDKIDYMDDLNAAIESGQYKDAFLVALEMPLTFDEYMNFFVTPTGKNSQGYKFNRSGFVLEPVQDRYVAFENLNKLSLCNLKNDGNTAKIINQLSKTEGTMFNFQGDFWGNTPE